MKQLLKLSDFRIPTSAVAEKCGMEKYDDGDIIWYRLKGGKKVEIQRGEVIVDIVVEYREENDFERHASTHVVLRKEYLTDEELASIISSSGLSDKEAKEYLDFRDIISYGMGATPFSAWSNKYFDNFDHNDIQLKYCLYQAQTLNDLFGFVMDEPANRIGHSHWNFLEGDLSMETAAANRKMYLGEGA
jgi:hypothetical protein